VTLESFADDKLGDPRVRELTRRVSIHRDADLTRRYPEGIPNRLRVSLSDGQTLTQEVTWPRGHARNPMTDTEVESKFLTATAAALGEPRGRRLLEDLWSLDRATDLTALAAALRQND
jgi:2-methylcitrate dehydratase